MTGISNRGRGVTLVEVLITGTMFGLFTGMVAGAMKMARQAQDCSVAKVEMVRLASVALDSLARDLEAGRYSSMVLMNGAPVPTEPVAPEGLQELQISRFRDNPLLPGENNAESVRAGYWFIPPNDSSPGEIRRTVYQAYTVPLQPVPGESEDGRVLARGVKRFLVRREVTDGITFIKADIWVGTLGNPISTAVAMEKPSS